MQSCFLSTITFQALVMDLKDEASACSTDDDEIREVDSVYPRSGSSSRHASLRDAVEPSLTARAICALLETDSNESLGEVFSKVARLDARRLPDLSADQLDPRRTPRCACFDTAGAHSAQASWSCHTICERCSVLNQLIQGE